MSLQNKQKMISEAFLACTSLEERYEKIILWGKKLPPFLTEWKVPEKLVSGCQSIMHLHAEIKEGKVIFFASSEALISSGLAAILITLYNGESPETVLKEPPLFLEEIGITGALTLSRANGLAGLYRKMQQEALQFLIQAKG